MWIRIGLLNGELRKKNDTWMEQKYNIQGRHSRIVLVGDRYAEFFLGLVRQSTYINEFLLDIWVVQSDLTTIIAFMIVVVSNMYKADF